MSLTRDELVKRFPKATESFLRLNADTEVSHSAIGSTGPRQALTPRAERVAPPTLTPSQASKPLEVAFSADIHELPSLLYFTRFVPVRVISEANMWDHWSQRQKRTRLQREAVNIYLRNLRTKGKPTSIFLQRADIARLDGDNLQTAFKHVRDELADILGFNDRDESVRWYYEQKTGVGKGLRGFTVSIAWRGAPMCPHCGCQP